MNRILHVVKAMNPAGVENMLMNLYRVLDKEHFQFDFLVNEFSPNYYEKEILSLGGKLYRVPTFAAWNLLQYKKHVHSLLKENPQWKIIHGHLGSAAPVYLNVANKLNRVSIAHSHNTYPENSILAKLENLPYRALTFPTRYIADYFFACSYKAGLDRYGNKAVSKTTFHVLKNGIDLERFHNSSEGSKKAREALGLSDEFVIGSVARLTPQKNLSFLIDVFALIKERVPNATLLIIGEGSEKNKLEQQVKNLNLQNSIRFLGITKNPENYVKAFDVFAMTSLYEGLCVALIEAQALGIPCIASDGIPPEAIITNNVQQLSTNLPKYEWAEAFLNYTGLKKQYEQDNIDVKKAGYDVCDTTRWLEKFYLQAMNGI